MGTRSSKRQRKEGIAPAAEAPSQASGKRSQAAAAAPSAPAPGAPKRPAGKRKPAAPKSKVRQQTITINRAPVLTLWAAVVAQREGMRCGGCRSGGRCSCRHSGCAAAAAAALLLPTHPSPARLCSWDAALTVGRWVSGTLAHSKGRSLGVFAEHERSEEEVEARRRRDEEQGVQRVQAFGMKVPAVLVSACGCGRQAAGTEQQPQVLRAARPAAARPDALRPPPRATCASPQVGGERRAVSGGSPISPASVQSYLKRAFKEDLTAAKVGWLAGGSFITMQRQRSGTGQAGQAKRSAPALTLLLTTPAAPCCCTLPLCPAVGGHGGAGGRHPASRDWRGGVHAV